MAGGLSDIPMMFGLSDKQFSLVGYVAVSWNSAEEGFEERIWQLASWPDDFGRLITSDMQNVSRILLYKNLLRREVRDSQLLEEGILFADFFDALRTRRNDIVHALPRYDWKESGFTSYIKRTAKPGSGTIKVKQVDFDFVALNQLISDLALLNLTDYVMFSKFQIYKNFHGSDEATIASAVHRVYWREPAVISDVRERLAALRQPPCPSTHQPPPRS